MIVDNSTGDIDTRVAESIFCCGLNRQLVLDALPDRGLG